MIGFGTIINSVAILCGGIIGHLFGNKLNIKTQETIIVGNGICVLFIGISGVLKEMFRITSNGLIETHGIMMAIVCMVVGGLIGEIFGIESLFEKFGLWLKTVTKNTNDPSFIDAFITASLTVCIGAMAVVGGIEDGIKGDYSILIAKSAIDFITIMIFAASMGKGAIFSFIPVFIFQYSVTILARLISPIMTEIALSNLSLVGSMLIVAVGINLIFDRRIRIANFLPSLILVVIWGIIIK